MLKRSSIISVSPEIMGATPVFACTRVPVQTLLDYLKAGESIDNFLVLETGITVGGKTKASTPRSHRTSRCDRLH